MARLHFLCLKHAGDSKLMRVVFYLNFLIPLAVSLSWLKSGAAQVDLNLNSTQSNTTTEETKVVNEFIAAIVPNVTNATNATGIAQLQQTLRSAVYSFIMANNLKVLIIFCNF